MSNKIINIGLGLTQIVGEQINKIVSDLEKSGHVNRSEGKKLARKLISEANNLQKSFSARVDKHVSMIVKSASDKTKAKKAGPKAKSKR